VASLAGEQVSPARQHWTYLGPVPKRRFLPRYHPEGCHVRTIQKNGSISMRGSHLRWTYTTRRAEKLEYEDGPAFEIPSDWRAK